jgi:hypothetical protein
MYKQRSGSIIYMGSVHSKEASVLKARYVTTKHGLVGLAKVVAKEGDAHGVRANVICPGFVRTPLVEKQIPEQAKDLGISEQDVIKNVMLRETVDCEFTTVDDVAETALFLASFGSNALTGQSIVVSHGWFMRSNSEPKPMLDWISDLIVAFLDLFPPLFVPDEEHFMPMWESSHYCLSQQSLAYLQCFRATNRTVINGPALLILAPMVSKGV